MVTTLCDACPQDSALMAQALFASTKRPTQIEEIGAAAVAQCDPLEIVPQPCDRIECGRVAGQLLQVQAFGRTAGAVVLAGLAALHGCAVPDDQHLAADLTRASRAGSARHRGCERHGPASAQSGAPQG